MELEVEELSADSKLRFKEEHRFKKEHYKIILEWLENPRNFERLHGSRSKTKVDGVQEKVVPKRVVYGELVRHLQQKAKVKILGLDAQKMQSRHEFFLSKFKSAKKQSERAGFGVTLQDQAKKIHTIAAKLEKLCPFYSRMLVLYGERDNVSPSPTTHKLGCLTSGAKRFIRTSSYYNKEEGEEVEEEEEAGTKVQDPRRDNADCQNVVSDSLSDLPDVASPTASDIQVPVSSIPVSSVGGSQAGLRSNNRGGGRDEQVELDSQEENTSSRGGNRCGNSLPKKRDTGKTKEKQQAGGGGLEATFVARQASMTAHLSEKLLCEWEWRKEELAMQDRHRREDREDRERLRAIEREEREVERQSQKDHDIRTFLLQLISQNKSPQEIEEYMQIFRRHY